MKSSPLRKHALQIFRAALAAADPEDAVTRHLDREDYDRFQNIYVVGAGKAGASMAHATERLLKGRITAGLVNVKYGHLARLRRIELNECGHPVPDENSFAATQVALDLVKDAGEGDTVLFLLSGGGSALFEKPLVSGEEGYRALEIVIGIYESCRTEKPVNLES